MPLSPSHRLTLLKEISSRLAPEDWTLIDVTLTQFGIQTQATWSGTTSAYVLEMTKGASDQALIDLAQHVGFQFDEAPKQVIDPPFWRKRMFRVFVSHLAAHKKLAAELQEELYGYGISAFVAHNDIEPTQEWQVQIETALATADALVALLHTGFHASNWTDQEIGFAMGRGIPIFSVRIESDPYGFIGRFQAFQGLGKPTAALSKELFDAYRSNKQSERRMSEVLVGLFEESGSFADAKRRIGYLEQLKVWHPSFSGRLQSLVESNGQVSGSWGVPARVAALIKKWIDAGS